MPRRRDKYQDDGDIWEDDIPRRTRRGAPEEEPAKAPVMLRILAWVGIILLCFVGGYLGTSWAIKFLNQKDLLVQKDVVKNTEELNKFLATDTPPKTADQVDAKKFSIKLYYPHSQENKLLSENLDIISGLKEEDIAESLARIFLVSEMFPKDVSVKQIFRNAGILYLDVGGPFIQMLAQSGQEKSALFIMGIVRTMAENFAPIAEVRFLVNGQVTTAGSPVDLTIAWRLPR